MAALQQTLNINLNLNLNLKYLPGMPQVAGWAVGGPGEAAWAALRRRAAHGGDADRGRAAAVVGPGHAAGALSSAFSSPSGPQSSTKTTK